MGREHAQQGARAWRGTLDGVNHTDVRELRGTQGVVQHIVSGLYLQHKDKDNTARVHGMYLDHDDPCWAAGNGPPAPISWQTQQHSPTAQAISTVQQHHPTAQFNNTAPQHRPLAQSHGTIQQQHCSTTQAISIAPQHSPTAQAINTVPRHSPTTQSYNTVRYTTPQRSPTNAPQDSGANSNACSSHHEQPTRTIRTQRVPLHKTHTAQIQR